MLITVLGNGGSREIYLLHPSIANTSHFEFVKTLDPTCPGLTDLISMRKCFTVMNHMDAKSSMTRFADVSDKLLKLLDMNSKNIGKYVFLH